MDCFIHMIYSWQIYQFRNKSENAGSSLFFLAHSNFFFFFSTNILNVIAANKKLTMKMKRQKLFSAYI